jgi:hypothetical protein
MWISNSFMGKTEKVSGVGYVTTQFKNISWVPIYPMVTVLVVDENHKFFNHKLTVIPIETSWKSILVGYCRAWLILAPLVFMAGLENPNNKLQLIAGGVGIVVWLWSMFSWRSASPERQQELQEIADHGERQELKI